MTPQARTLPPVELPREPKPASGRFSDERQSDWTELGGTAKTPRELNLDAIIYTTVLLFLVVVSAGFRRRFLSFRGQRPADYVGLGPDFDLATRLSGDLICEGVIFGPTGRVTSRFQARMQGTWFDEGGTLAQQFDYDGGAAQERAWNISFENMAQGRFEARADDVDGIGHGIVEGPSVQMRYRIVLPQDAGGYRLDVVDWMYLMENGTIINRSQFRKFGLLVAELVATIRREAA